MPQPLVSVKTSMCEHSDIKAAVTTKNIYMYLTRKIFLAKDHTAISDTNSSQLYLSRDEQRVVRTYKFSGFNNSEFN